MRERERGGGNITAGAPFPPDLSVELCFGACPFSFAVITATWSSCFALCGGKRDWVESLGESERQ